jgi:hypothetical protein
MLCYVMSCYVTHLALCGTMAKEQRALGAMPTFLMRSHCKEPKSNKTGDASQLQGKGDMLLWLHCSVL